MNLRESLIDPKSPDRRPRRAAYALPTLFTAGNVYLGFYTLVKVFEGCIAMVTAPATAYLHFQAAALAIGVSFVLDGLGLYNPQLAITNYPDLREWLTHYREVGRRGQVVVYRLSSAASAE